MIRNLLQKTTNNIKSGQYADAPTCLVLNLLLIDGYHTGWMLLALVAVTWLARPFVTGRTAQAVE
jgi:hypothetical protein